VLLRKAIAIRHVGFEDLGSFALPIRNAGYEITYLDAGVDDIAHEASGDPDLLIVLGGPIGAYEEGDYPFLKIELDLLERRLAADRPTLGVCLGAQLMARALGSRVYPGPAKEIGWASLQLTDAGHASPLRHLGDHPVLHWHGDTFDLPAGCDRLASTAVCQNQAFARGTNLLGLQFHPEVLGVFIERWLIGHAAELAGAGISPVSIRRDTTAFTFGLEERAISLLRDWLAAMVAEPAALESAPS
jgi:GMP synthase (glutamine-hydrolysing)